MIQKVPSSNGLNVRLSCNERCKRRSSCRVLSKRTIGDVFFLPLPRGFLDKEECKVSTRETNCGREKRKNGSEGVEWES